MRGMYEEDSLLLERLKSLLSALERIPRRLTGIKTASDFLSSEDGLDKLDAICMILIATGEAIKQIDRKTQGQLLNRYPQIDWKGIKGIRDVIAHGYFDIDAEQVFAVCCTDIPILIETVQKIINDLNDHCSY
jgi:uncharacterized protein with HEPN domain